MRNQELAAVLDELRRAGIHDPVIAPTARHLQVRWPTPSGFRFHVVPSSGSDWRGPHNARSAVRRKLRDDGLLPMNPEPLATPTAPAKRDWRTEIARLEQRIMRLEAQLEEVKR
jgi:hypothetical protein